MRTWLAESIAQVQGPERTVTFGFVRCQEGALPWSPLGSLNLQPGDLLEFAQVEGCQHVIHVDSRCSDYQVVCANRAAAGCDFPPDPRVYPGDREVEGDHRNGCQHSFDERRAACTSARAGP